jgi:hypothetical protein
MADRSSLEAAKVEAAIGNRILAEVGLASGVRASLGHVSLRVPGDQDLFVVKGRGYRLDVLSRMRPEDMVVCDLEGNWRDGPPYSLQCSEVKIHSCIYKHRPDVVSVVHVHPDYVVLMSVLEHSLKPMAQEGIGLGDQAVACLPPHENHHLGGGGAGGSPLAGRWRGVPAARARGGDGLDLGSAGCGARDAAPGAPSPAELHGHVRGWSQPSVHSAALG